MNLERMEAVLAIVLAAGIEGLKASEVSERSGLKPKRTSAVLSALLRRKCVEKSVSMGPHVRWGPPGCRAYWKPLLKTSECMRERQQRSRRAQAEAAGESWEGQPIRRWVRAEDAPRPETRAVSSVWGLAA